MQVRRDRRKDAAVGKKPMINYALIYAAYESERTASFYLDGLLTPTSIDAWRPTGRSSTTSTRGARWGGCT